MIANLVLCRCEQCHRLIHRPPRQHKAALCQDCAINKSLTNALKIYLSALSKRLKLAEQAIK